MKQEYAVITGASSGIGTEFARRLAKEGYKLILIARRKERLLELANELDTECRIITADLSDMCECKRVLNEIDDKNIEVFINNAGFGVFGEFSSNNLETEVDMIEANVKAVHILTKIFLNEFKKKNADSYLKKRDTIQK